MNNHLIKDLDRLKTRLINVAMAVEENARKSVKALRELSSSLAIEVVKNDKAIDQMEVDIEEECLKILALHQPVASDLRFVITVLKINAELEHIGDMAVNIAKRVPYILKENRIAIPFDIETISCHTIHMLKASLDAFTSGDEMLAVGVCREDDIVDEENRKCYINIQKEVSQNPENAFACINYLLVCRSLERMADLCTNIAEDVIYMKKSLIVRHNLEAALKQIKNSNDRE